MSALITAELIAAVVSITRAAGDAILTVYNDDAFEVQTKDDASPLTQADLAAHEVIVRGLTELTPDVPILSEESTPPAFSERSHWQRYWLVDPLDGTKEFVNRNGEFTVNIALVADGQPVLGVVGVPVTGEVYVGDVTNAAAWLLAADGSRTTLSGRAVSHERSLIVVASRSHGSPRLEQFIDALGASFPGVERSPIGSSLKLCKLARGEADFYPRLGPTSEWDIGAAQAVLVAAGGSVWAVDGSALTYNQKESFLNPEFFAAADGSFAWAAQLPPVPAAD